MADKRRRLNASGPIPFIAAAGWGLPAGLRSRTTAYEMEVKNNPDAYGYSVRPSLMPLMPMAPPAPPRQQQYVMSDDDLAASGWLVPGKGRRKKKGGKGKKVKKAKGRKSKK